MGKSLQKRKPSLFQTVQQCLAKYGSLGFAKSIVLSTDYLAFVSVLLLVAELFVSLMVVHNVKYTEIDWKAYMQEVEGFLNGTSDYALLKGDTGPLVYPAGFVYFYSALHYLTDKGSDIRLGQYAFVIFYLLFLSLVFRIYIKTKKVPGYVLAIMSLTSYRIHSIFMLRLFNDPIAMLLLYASFNLFLESRWSLGSLFYSLAVSVKMNILLFAPGLLLAYLTSLGLKDTIYQLGICATVQFVLGLPFLLTNPYSYLKGSFDLGRVFLHEWTVNWRFLPESVFVNPLFHLGLLFAHIFTLCLFFKVGCTYLNSFARLKCIESDLGKKKNQPKIDMGSAAQLFILPLFLCNFIGVALSRSLHYQFYVWYYHTLPYLLWSTRLSTSMKLMLLGLIEMAWNTYPSTYFSSGVLHLSHLIILHNLYKTTTANIKTD
ncbi:lethal(2)neighbour of Tid protein [Cimex lectularius]|uniref:dolichyl-P-Man:Man5GlcNAc2-PP-dolichol alpha-1,3-mannosyltransferase n=1 Tax=Cimex lectularius TaxID=79782 RepID=A0A8I6RCV7_CIMLE|nr:lethal(2)neighbour of Tid protein [Cimex lectularius]